MMLSWIFFRAEDLSTALQMYGKVLTPGSYGALGLRENFYLIAALLMAGIIGFFFIQGILSKPRKLFPIAASLGECVYLTAIVSLVIILRPIQQFIYFQF